MKKAIIFDLDGTLWDATEAVTALWNRYLPEFAGVQANFTQEQVTSFMGLGPEALAAAYMPDIPEPQRMDYFYRIIRMENTFIPTHGARLFDGLHETLAQLSQDYSLMVASNCCSGYIEAFIGYAGVEAQICDLEHPERTGLEKAGNIRLLMERNGIDRAIMVGDTRLDYEAAVGAGVPFVLAEYGFGSVPEAQYRIASMRELPELAAKLFDV